MAGQRALYMDVACIMEIGAPIATMYEITVIWACRHTYEVRHVFTVYYNSTVLLSSSM